MTPYEEMDRFKIGLEIGLYSLDELSGFIDEKLSVEEPIPYIYIDVAMAISHGTAKVFDCIFQNFTDNRYTPNRTVDCLIKKAILRDIQKLYASQKITLKQTCEFLHILSSYFEPYTIMDVVSDYYDLAKEGIVYTMDQVTAVVAEILMRGSG